MSTQPVFASPRPQVAQQNVILETVRGFDVILSGRFSLATDAMSAMDQYTHRYHPSGYSTTFQNLTLEDGVFIVRGHRFSSCD